MIYHYQVPLPQHLSDDKREDFKKRIRVIALIEFYREHPFTSASLVITEEETTRFSISGQPHFHVSIDANIRQS